jgi:hypothetical protein
MADKEPPEGPQSNDEEPINSPEALERWLETAPSDVDQRVEWARVIAVRAALRVFPLVLNHATIEGLSDRNLRNLKYLPLSTWRAVFMAHSALKYSASDLVAANSAAARPITAPKEAPSAAVATASADASSKAAASAAWAVSDVVEPIRASLYAAQEAMRAAVFVASAAAIDTWRAIDTDCHALVLGELSLVDRPLWLRFDKDGIELQAGQIPDWVLEAADEFHQSEFVEHTSWWLLSEWYGTVLPLRSIQHQSSAFGVDNDIWIATRNDSFWDREPVVVLDEIAEHIGWMPMPLAHPPREVDRVDLSRIVEVASPTASINASGQFDFSPNPETDSGGEGDETIDLLRRQSALCDVVIAALPKNAPPHLVVAINRYKAELMLHGALPALGLLQDMVVTLRSAIRDQDETDPWLPAERRQPFEQFHGNHVALMAQFSKSSVREEVYAKVFLDEEKAGDAISEESRALLEAVRVAHESGLTTDEFLRLVELQDEAVRFVLSQPSKPHSDDGDLSNVRPQRVATEVPVKKRTLLQTLGFASQVVSKAADASVLADSEAVQDLGETAGELASELGSLIQNLT